MKPFEPEIIETPKWMEEVLREIVRQNSQIIGLLAMTKIWIPENTLSGEDFDWAQCTRNKEDDKGFKIKL